MIFRIDVDDILDIHKYSMKKHLMKRCVDLLKKLLCYEVLMGYLLA